MRPASPTPPSGRTPHYERLVRGGMPMVPGAADFVARRAAAGHRLAIVSGRPAPRDRAGARSATGLARYFELIVAAEDVPACKPDPAGYNQARGGAADSPPADCVVIEDSLPGLAAARAAGLRCAMLSTSHPADALKDADSVWPDFTGRRPADLPWANGNG